MGGGIFRIQTEEQFKKTLKGLIVSIFIMFFVMVIGITLGGFWKNMKNIPLIEWIGISAVIVFFVGLIFLIYLMIEEVRGG